ncbi:hypothetical protein FZC84_21345 [Rossellomorea vietnamensis]|uniref:Uncharacterized protein n=1 Tax=Rossellomorea vietnamensis TaxID=218284 RepID=A0A5D4M3W0_9BACI|nr:hypothetical protein [Rossellomorea vietnamensis]TYR95740.1 hypothetical protein FZC84_21345 [Rossellomorea vietnamensis]
MVNIDTSKLYSWNSEAGVVVYIASGEYEGEVFVAKVQCFNESMAISLNDIYCSNKVSYNGRRQIVEEVFDAFRFKVLMDEKVVWK